MNYLKFFVSNRNPPNPPTPPEDQTCCGTQGEIGGGGGRGGGPGLVDFIYRKFVRQRKGIWSSFLKVMRKRMSQNNVKYAFTLYILCHSSKQYVL
jgi:hypothetical protein